MKLIPDPHVWRVMIPRIRKLCGGCRGWDGVLPEGENGKGKKRNLELMRAAQAYKNAKKVRTLSLVLQVGLRRFRS
jgi:hypothetical protein